MYGKLFVQMYDGTLATKGPWQALATFQQLIILADKHGIVDMTADAIARRTTFPLEVIQLGIAELEKPDPDSRTPDEDGRRIVRLNDSRAWGWRIVNHGHYRRIRTEEERREYHRNYQRNRRAKKAVNSDVNTSTRRQQNQPIAVSSKQDAISSKHKPPVAGARDADASKSESGSGPHTNLGLSAQLARFVGHFYESASQGRRAWVVTQLQSALDPKGPGALIRGDYVKARDLAHLELCCTAVLHKPPIKADAAIVWVLRKLQDPCVDSRGLTVTEAASVNTRVEDTLLNSWNAEASFATATWARGHPDEFKSIERLAVTFAESERMSSTEPGYDVAVRGIVAKKAREAAGFPEFDDWHRTRKNGSKTLA